MNRDTLLKELNQYLGIYDYDDYCQNGLQIEGSREIKKIAFAVSATKESIHEAIKNNADTLIVHHALFWKFHGAKTLTGPFYKRVAPLIKNDINLIGYHLPLDAHLEVGNAKSIADLLDLKEIKAFGDHKGMPTGIRAQFKNPILPSELAKKLEKILNHSVIHSSPSSDPIHSIGIITGGANSNWRDCKKFNLDAYLTGEISEHDWHEAKEDGIHFYAGGHHATEKFGIQNLKDYISKKYNHEKIETFFIDSLNPA